MKGLPKCTGWLILALAIALSSGQRTAAQGGVTVKLDSVDASQYPELSVAVTVIDENGLPVTDLTADRFELIEDGQASFPPDRAQMISNDDAAASVLILIDLGGTMKGAPLDAAREATGKFLDNLLNKASDQDRAAFMGIGPNVNIQSTSLADDAREVPFTDDKGRLMNIVNFLEVNTDAGTPLYDALYRAVKITAAQPGRRAIIVMTDGRDVGSTLKDGDPIAEAQRQHIPVFPIGLSNSRLDRSYLQRLAELTGGLYQEAPTPDEVAQKFQEVLAQLKVQYALTYQSRLPKGTGQYHSLLVRVNTPRGQGFDEAKFQLGQPAPTSQPGEQPASLTPQPQGTTVQQPTATPVKEVGMSEGVSGLFNDNPLIAVGLIVAAILLLALVALIVILVRRRSAEPAQAWGGDAGAGEAFAPAPAQAPWGKSAEPPGQAGFTEAGPSLAVPGMSSAAGLTGPTSKAPGVADGGTWVAPTDLPVSPKPFGVPAAPPVGRPDEEEGTVVLARGPKPKVIGFLVDRKQPTRRYDLDKPAVTIGRAAGNTIVIDHPTVSRQHATIKLENADFRLYDLGSANGTFTGDQRVREPVTLQDGVIVRFGEVEFVFKRMSLE